MMETHYLSNVTYAPYFVVWSFFIHKKQGCSNLLCKPTANKHEYSSIHPLLSFIYNCQLFSSTAVFVLFSVCLVIDYGFLPFSWGFKVLDYPCPVLVHWIWFEFLSSLSIKMSCFFFHWQVFVFSLDLGRWPSRLI